MPDVALIHSNIAPLCNSIFATSQQSDHPVENVLTEAPAETFRSNSGTAEIVARYNSPVSFSGIALVNHNIPQSATKIQFIYSNDNFVNYETENLTWHVELIYISKAINSYKDFKIYVETDQDYVEIGQIVFGTFYIFPDLIVFPIKKTPVNNVLSSRSPLGQKATKLLSRVWQFTLNLKYVYNSDYLDIVEACKRGEPKILILNTDTREAYQGEILSDLGSEETVSGNRLSIEFEQNPNKIEA
jgi:hypothetical protein